MFKHYLRRLVIWAITDDRLEALVDEHEDRLDDLEHDLEDGNFDSRLDDLEELDLDQLQDKLDDLEREDERLADRIEDKADADDLSNLEHDLAETDRVADVLGRKYLSLQRDGERDAKRIDELERAVRLLIEKGGTK